MANNQNPTGLFNVVGNGGVMHTNIVIPLKTPLEITSGSLNRLHRHFWGMHPNVHHLNNDVNPDGTLVSPTAQEQFLNWLEEAMKNKHTIDGLLNMEDRKRLELSPAVGSYMQPYAIPLKRPAGNFPPMATKYLRDSFISELSEEQRTQLCFDHGPDGHFTTEATAKLFNGWIDNKIAAVGAMQMGKHMLSLHERGTVRKPFKNGMPPMHPGLILKEMYLDEMKMPVCVFAKHIGVSPVYIHNLIDGTRDIDVRMAFRFSKALGTTVEFWLNLQNTFAIRTLEVTTPGFADHIQLINKEAQDA